MNSTAALLRRTFLATVDHLVVRMGDEVDKHLRDVPQVIGSNGRVVLIAFGKASRTMARRAIQALSPVRERITGLLVPANDDVDPLPPLEVIAGGHPLPTTGSFSAAARAMALARAAGPEDYVVFLVSGGGSSLLESPIEPAVSVAAWQRLQQALIGSGASIERINAVRMRLSAVKGGRLAAAASSAGGCRTLFVSDVPGSFESIASGPTVRCRALGETLRQDLDELQLWDALPAELRARVDAGTVPPLPADEEIRGDAVTIVDEGHGRRYAAAQLRDAGLVVDESLDVDDLPVERAADLALQHLARLSTAHGDRPVAVVTTGELSVPLPTEVGQGGRNQHFALACARRIAGRAITVLSCGTDGVDGNSPAAGAVVDGETAGRAAACRLDVDDHLRRCDAHTLLRELGCTVATGPTGVNVRDLRILSTRTA